MSNHIRAAARAAFPYTLPMLAGFAFLGISYGLYMKAMGFNLWYPVIMAALIYAGSVEFILTALLVAPFAPFNVLLITLILSGRQIFYSISMLKKYDATMGKKRNYLIASIVDESFSLNYMANIPQGIDKGWYYFWVSLFLHIYWVVGAAVGNLFGDIIPFNLKGVEFAMTALFIVIFAESWLKEKSHESAFIGLGAALFFLLLVGKDYFLMPTLFAIWGILTLRRPKLESKIICLEKSSKEE